MKSRVTFLVVLLLASLVAAGLTTSSVDAQGMRYGATMDQIKFRVIKGPDAATLAMVSGQIDILTDLMRPVDIETLYRSGKSLLSMPGDQFCYLCFNMRPQREIHVKDLPFGPQDGSQPGLALRHAIAHLVPKANLIGQLFKYVCTQVEVPMSASLGTFGADVDTHPYDPTMARNVLLAAGWTWDGSDWHVPSYATSPYPLPPGSVLPAIEFFSPTLAAAPTSWTIANVTGQNMIDIGIKVSQSEYDLTTMMDMIHAGDFEMFLLSWQDMGRFGDHLYHFFHSPPYEFPSIYNQPGLRNDTLDAVLADLYTTLDKTYMEQKVAEALELLMGTSAYQNSLSTDGLIPYVPIYSRTYYDAYDLNLLGAVNAKLKGSWNYWTASNMNWEPGYERASDLVPGGTMAIFRQSEDFQAGDAGGANPAWVSSTVTWDMLTLIYEGLIGMNPYNLKDKPGWLDLTRDPDPNTTPGFTIIPWTVTDGPRAGETGMKVTFYLDTTVARPWHDGHIWDAYDVAFAWEYMTVNKIPRGWGTFQYFHHCTIEAANTIIAYMTTTGITIPYGLSEWSSMLPEHVWGCTTQRDGRATASCVSDTAHERTNAWNSMVSHINSGAIQGTAGNKLATDPDATADSGLCLCALGTQDAGGKLTCVHGSGCVLDDWATAENEILDYDPAAYSWPTTAYPWLTEQIGTGPWIFHDIDAAGGTGNLIAFNGADHYPKTVDEIYNMLVEYFWEIGDVDLDGQITMLDIALLAANYLKPVPPAPWRCDLNKDGIVDIRDVTIAGINYGEERARRHTMHVQSIDFKQKGKRLDIMIKIYDDTNNPLSGATVLFDLTYPDGTVVIWLSAVTDTKGIATYTISIPEKGPYTVTIQAVSYGSLSYNPNDNVETTDTYIAK